MTKLDIHLHNLPRPTRWRARGRVYACDCGALFIVKWGCAMGDCIRMWEQIGDVNPDWGKKSS